MDKELESYLYDKDILAQGMQFQIDNYYQPKEISMVRRIEIVLSELQINPFDKVLDVGCGVGTFAFHTAKSNAISFGIDYSLESIKMACKLADKFNVTDRCHFLVGNAFSLPFQDNFFDKVIAADFIEHITYEGKMKFLKELYRVLKPEGVGIIFTPNGTREWFGELYWRLRHFVFGDKVPISPLHIGLINRYQLESIIREYKFNFKLQYRDITRPYLAKIPFLRNFLALNLLWILYKEC